MKRTAGEYAILLGLLDEALDLPESARTQWVEQLSEPYAELRPTLRRLLLQEPARETGEILGMAAHVGAILRDVAAQPPARELEGGARIGPYQLIRELGRGGMGSVWLAERADGAFKRSVALKLPHVTWVGGLAERMARERDILAGLDHPNIARFYDAGVDQFGRPFMAMEYVKGVPIDVYCRERRLSIRDRLALVLDVAKAVAHAHSRLVVHRDLKPGNILVTPDGEVRLLDFGIAKLIEGDSARENRLTQFAGRLLTPDFASPEQIKGEPIGTATDVYSLAVVSYELLTDARPYKLRRESAAELEAAIAEADPLPASEATKDKSRRRQLRGDVDAILNKAMKKNPADRYATVDAFASDLLRHLRGETVVARPDRAIYRMRKFVGRHRTAFAASTVVLVALVVATTVSLLQAREATRQAEKATAMKDFLLHVFTAGDNRAAGSKPPGQVTALELLDEGSTELIGALGTQPAVKIELIQAMGDIYERMDAGDKTIALYRAGVKFADDSYGPNSTQKADLLARIAGSLVFAGRWVEGEQAIAEAEQAFDASGDHRSLAYAQLLKFKGNLQRRHGPGGAIAARNTLKQAAALFAKYYPLDEGYTGTLMFLATAHMALDEMPEADAAANSAVAAARKLTNDASELAHTISLRASVEDQLGDFAGAERDYDEASKLYASTVGTKHFFYLQNENLRGQLLHLSGRREPGLSLIRSTTEEIARVRPGSNTLANSLERLTSAYLREKSFDDADRTATRALELEPTRQVAALHNRVLFDRANALLGLGRFGEATKTVGDALRAADAEGKPGNYMIAETELALAGIALASGNLTEGQSKIASAKSFSVSETRRIRHQRARILLLESRLAWARGDVAKAASCAAAARGITDAADIRGDWFLRSDVMAAENQTRQSGSVRSSL